MRTPWWVVPMVAGLVAAAAPQPAPPQPQGFGDAFKAATAAYDAKDYARMEQSLRRALEQRPFHPAAMYNLAAAFALQGKADDAKDVLRTLARQGLVYAPASDPDFASLKDDVGFNLLNGGFDNNRHAVGHPSRDFELKGPAFIPDGMAYDNDTSAFFVGSAHERRIQRIKSDEEHDFVKAGAGGLWSALGMFADSKRRLLWVATAALAETQDVKPEEVGRSGLLAFDLDSGALKKTALLPDDHQPHALADVTVTPKGAVYATDSLGGTLYALDPEHGTFTALTQPGQLASPRGLAVSRDRDSLFIADYATGLYKYDIDDKKLTRLEFDREICVYGVDGLYRFGDDLIAVQNGIRPHRVVRFRLTRSGRRVEHAQVLAANLPEFDEPALGVVVGRHFSFVANSQRGRFDKAHHLPPDDKLKPPLVLRLTLEEYSPDRDDRQGTPQQTTPGSPVQLPPVTLPRLGL